MEETMWWVRVVLRLLIGAPLYVAGLVVMIVGGCVLWIVVEDNEEYFPFRKFSNTFAELVLDGF